MAGGPAWSVQSDLKHNRSSLLDPKDGLTRAELRALSPHTEPCSGHWITVASSNFLLSLFHLAAILLLH